MNIVRKVFEIGPEAYSLQQVFNELWGDLPEARGMAWELDGAPFKRSARPEEYVAHDEALSRACYQVRLDPAPMLEEVELRLWYGDGPKASPVIRHLCQVVVCSWSKTTIKAKDAFLLPNGRVVHRDAYTAAMRSSSAAAGWKVTTGELLIYDLEEYDRQEIADFMMGKQTTTGPAPFCAIPFPAERRSPFVFIKTNRHPNKHDPNSGLLMVEVLNNLCDYPVTQPPKL